MFTLNEENKKNYHIKSITYIKELDINIIEILHKKTFMKLFLYETKDDNKVFNIVFKTPSINSKGTAHILEHSVLCGSRKYDVKDPFIELAKSSMNTFLNAMTYTEKTCYPVASVNDQDFKNLMDVYLDAVFFPNIYKNKNIFLQEGWHLELDNGKVIPNGVVLNEMKGVYSDPHSILEYGILNTLFEGSAYGYESGGNPNEILKLTYEEFLDFHKKYYHPTNAILYLYGNMDFNERLAYIENEYLQTFCFDKEKIVDYDDYIDADKYYLEEFAEKGNIEKTFYYNALDENSKSFIAYTKLFTIIDVETRISLEILDYILFKQEGAVIKERLLKENILDTVSTTIEVSLYMAYISIVAENIDVKNKKKFVDIIEDELKNVIDKGIDEKKLMSGIHTIYFSYLENDIGLPKGLNLILKSMDTDVYDRGVGFNLYYKDYFDKLNQLSYEELNEYFIGVLESIYSEIKNSFITILSPKNDLIATNEKQIEEYIKTLNLDDTTKEKIEENIRSLDEFRNSETDASKLPSLKVSDIPKEKNILTYNIEEVEEKNILTTYLDINDLIYLGLNFKLQELSDYEIGLLGILTELLSKVGTKNVSYNELNNMIDIYTGELSFKVYVLNDEVYFRVYAKTLVNDLIKTYDIISLILNESEFFDKDRIKIILQESKLESTMSILSRGHIVAFTRAQSSISKKAKYDDLTSESGIGYNLFINKIMKNFDAYYDNLKNDISKLLHKIISKENLFIDIGMSKDYKEQIFEKINVLYEKLDDNKNNYEIKKLFDLDDILRNSKEEAFVTANDVNFVARVGKYEIEKYTGALPVIATYLNYDYLWNKIRVIGGAYGCMSRFSIEGIGGFASFRDPNVSQTDDTFVSIKDEIKNIKLSDIKLNNLIISTIANFDNPISNSAMHEKNVINYFSKIDNTILSKVRTEILNTDISAIHQSYEAVNELINTNEICAIVSNDKQDEAKEKYKNIKSISIGD